MDTPLESNENRPNRSGEKGNWKLPVIRPTSARSYSNNCGENSKSANKKERVRKDEALALHATQHGQKQKRPWQQPGFKKDLTIEGIESNPGPQAKKPHKTKKKAPIVHVPGFCSGCKQPGHIYKYCPNKKHALVNKNIGDVNLQAPGGASAAAKKLVAAVNDAAAQAAGNADAAAEIAAAAPDAPDLLPAHPPGAPKKEEKPGGAKAVKDMVDLSHHSFVVRDVDSVVNENFSRIQHIMTWMGPIYAMLALVDWFAFPLFCGWFCYEIIRTIPLLTPAAASLTIAVWLFENLVVGFILYQLTGISRTFTERLKHSHVYEFGTPDLTPIDPLVDSRPHPMSFGPRTYVLSTTTVVQYETTEFHWRYFDIHFELHRRKVSTFAIAGAPFAHVAASFTTYKTPSETSQEVRRLLSKAGQYDWNTNKAVKERLVENTARTLDAYKQFVGQSEYDSPMQCFEDWWKQIAPYAKAGLCLVWIALLLGCLVFVATIFHSLTKNLATVAVSQAIKPHVTTAANFVTPIVSPYQQWLSENPITPPNYSRVFGARPADPIHQFGQLNDIAPNKDLSFNISDGIVFGQELDRKPAGIFSPHGVMGIAPLLHDRSDPLTTMVGVAHRGAGVTPAGDPARMARKREIAIEMLECLVDPHTSCADLVSFEDMLEALPYTQARKEELRRQHVNRPGDFYEPSPKKGDTAGPNRLNGIFDKYETSSAGKTSRTIHAMSESLWNSDILASVGRYVKSAEKAIYDYFPGNIKHLDPAGVVRKLMGLGPGDKITSDYKSYEASFTKAVKQAAQLAAYEYLFGHLPDGASITRHIDWLVNRTNDFKHKFFTGSISNLKCSGDFDTAFSNWFDNMVTWMAVFDEKGVHWTDAAEWVICEGDDNITDPHGLEFTAFDFEVLGMTAKLERHSDLSTAGFCQKFVNESTGTLIGDPIRFLGRRTYFDSKYDGASLGTLKSLSRATAMSALATFTNAPVISEWAYRVIELTAGITVRKAHILAQKTYGQVIDPLVKHIKPRIDPADRLAVSVVFDFTLMQQELFTEALAAWDGTTQLRLPSSWFPSEWTQFFQTYATNLATACDASVVTPVAKRAEQIWKWLEEPINSDEMKLTAYGDALRETLSLLKLNGTAADLASFEAPETDPSEDPARYIGMN